MTSEDPTSDQPKVDEPFGDPNSIHRWAEFQIAKIARNTSQAKVDISKPKKLWHYLGQTSTEAKAQYASDPANPVNDPAASFLDSVRPLVPVGPPVSRLYPASYSKAGNSVRPKPLPQPSIRPAQPPGSAHNPTERPYNGKYAIKDPLPTHKFPHTYHVDPQALARQHAFLNASTHPSFIYGERHHHQQGLQVHPAGVLPNPGPLPAAADAQRPQPASYHGKPGSAGPVSIPHPSCAPASNTVKGIDDANGYLQHPPQGSPPLAVGAPPVIDAMATATHTSQASPPQPPLSHQSSFEGANAMVEARSRSDSIKALVPYPYLYEAAMARPAVYQSPYAPGGGFTESWLPNPRAAKPIRPRAPSLSQEYLNNRTASQREGLKGHVRQISTEKAMTQKLEMERRQMEQMQKRASAENQFPFPLSPLPPAMMQNNGFPPQYHQEGFPRSPPFPDLHPPFPPPSNVTNILHHDHHLFGAGPQYQAPGLQFSSPHDFQLQMQREAHHSKISPPNNGPRGYDAFMKSLQAIGSTHPHSHGGQDTVGEYPADGMATSPGLKQGMRNAGGEMLPVMQDRHF
jgi:hypothetical protein